MARRPRLLPPKGIFHVTSRGNRRQSVFVDDDDRRYFLALLGDVVARYGWRCHAYCLMGNHYHAVVETPEGALSAGMHRLNGIYAQRFNGRHGLDGHLFQDRFHSVVVESDWQLLALARYVVVNPVRAGLTEHAGEWAWSSYRATAGLERAQAALTLDWLLGFFGRPRERARAAYRAFVDGA